MADEGTDQPEQAPAEASKRAPSTAKKKKHEDAPAPIPGAGTPEGERLRVALRAFDAGDYRRVRAEARELEQAPDPAVRQAAAALLARISTDPVQVVVMVACALVLFTIFYTWVF